MNKKALLSYSRGHFDPNDKEQKFYSASIIAKSLYDTLTRSGYDVVYIDPTEVPKDPGSYDLFVGQPYRWVELAASCDRALKVLFMPTSHPFTRNERMHDARKKWDVPRDEELLDTSSAALRAFSLADYIIQIGNELNIDSLLENGVPREKIIHIHYGLPSAWATALPPAQGPLDTYLHTASELGLRKGLPDLLKFFGALPFSSKKLTLVGNIRKNENYEYWHARIKELEQQNPNVTHIEFTDSTLTTYKELLASHAWYLFPSLEEGEPGTVLEAMTLGLVPVMTRASGIDFMLDDDFNASFETSLKKTLALSRDEWYILSTKAQRYVTLFHDHAAWEKRLTEVFQSLHKGERDLRPTASIILTVHDKEKHIVRLLETLIGNTKSYPRWDLHIVYDGCTDASRKVAQHVLHDFPVPVYEYETPDVWEVKANNHGLTRAQGKYCVILQDDNFIYEAGWLEKMLSWLEEHPNVGILGGLAGVNFFHLDSEPEGEGINRSTYEVHQRLDPATNKKLREYVFEADAVMRGPIILRKELLEKHGYLDEAYAPLYNDDMDYCFRMRSLGYGVFCYPIDVVNENLTVAKYKNPVKDKFWKDTAEKNQKIFYSRWSADIEKHHAYYLKVPKPLYADAPTRRFWGLEQTIKRKLLSLKTYDLRQQTRITLRALFLATPAPLARSVIRLVAQAGTRGKELSIMLEDHYATRK
jgi:GT2 family glycosyltransferase